MLCQNCNKRPATVHWTKMVNNKKQETHLCETCAKETEELDFGFESGFSLQNLLTGFMNLQHDHESGGLSKEKQGSGLQALQCDNCNLTYQQFGKVSRLGCGSCYQVFGEQLKSILRRIHGSTHHTGKIPKRKGGNLRIKRQIRQLKERLHHCIEREEFEKAAQIRDEIKQLNEELE